MSKLKILCEMYERTETEIVARQTICDNLGQQIMAIVSQLSPNVIHEYDVVLPKTLQNARQRISQHTQGDIMCHMRGLAEQHKSFTRPELLDAVKANYTSISTHILNRLFDAQGFERVGVRAEERGNPIIYAV